MEKAEAEFEEKKSVFIGHASPVKTEQEAKEYINEIKRSNKEARHNVYAYIVGENCGIQRYSDDGEPQGTGGIPVLEVIKKNGITDCVVVVTRYFGGILLGAGGLTRAYSKAAAVVVKKAGLVEKVKGCELELVIEYELLGKIQYHCEQIGLYIENIEYTDKVIITCYIEISNLQNIKREFLEFTSGKCVLKVTHESLFLKKEDRLYKM